MRSQGPPSEGPCGAPQTKNIGRGMSLSPEPEGRPGNRSGSRRMPRWGVGPLPFPVSHGLLPSLHRHRAPADRCRSPLGAAVAAGSLGSALHPLPVGAAHRGAAVAVIGQGKPTKQPRSGALGQWADVVRIVRRGRRSPERVWTLLALPLKSLPTAPAMKGAGGRRQQGRTPMLVLALAGWLLFRMAARQLCGSLNQEPPRSSWATRPQISG